MGVDLELDAICNLYITGECSTGNREKDYENLHEVLLKEGYIMKGEECEQCGETDTESFIGRCHDCDKFKCGPCYGNCIGGSRFYGGYVCQSCYYASGG